MAGSVNKVTLLGNLGADPDIRRNNAGDPIANLRIATSESWKDKNSGERKEKTEWHQVVIFGGLAKVAEQYLKKGTKIYVEGQLQTRKWKDQSGQDRYSTEVVLTPFKGELHILSGGADRDDRDSGGGRSGGGGGSRGNSRNDDRGQSNSNSGGGFGGGGFGGGDDEIPFIYEWR